MSETNEQTEASNQPVVETTTGSDRDTNVHEDTQKALDFFEDKLKIPVHFLLEAQLLDTDMMVDGVTITELLSEAHHFGNEEHVVDMMISIGDKERIQQYYPFIYRVQILHRYIESKSLTNINYDGDTIISARAATEITSQKISKYGRHTMSIVKRHTQAVYLSTVEPYLDQEAEILSRGGSRKTDRHKDGDDRSSIKSSINDDNDDHSRVFDTGFMDTTQPSSQRRDTDYSGVGYKDRGSNESESPSYTDGQSIGKSDSQTGRETRGRFNADASEQDEEERAAKNTQRQSTGRSHDPQRNTGHRQRPMPHVHTQRKTHARSSSSAGSLDDKEPPDLQTESDLTSKTAGKLLKRTGLPSTIKLKDASQFFTFKNTFISHVILQQAGYLVDDEFQQLYCEHGHQALNMYVRKSTGTKLSINKEQLDADVRILFAWLMGALADGVATHLIAEFMAEQDGIKMWRKLIMAFDDTAHRQSHAMTFQKKLQLPFKPNGTDTIAAYVANTQHYFAMYNSFAASDDAKYSDIQQRSHLLTKLRETGDPNMLMLVRAVEASNNYPSMGLVCQYITGESVLEDTINDAASQRHARPANRRVGLVTTDGTTDDMDELIETVVDVFAASQALRRHPSYIPDEKFHKLEDDVVKAILHMRRQIRELSNPGGNRGGGRVGGGGMNGGRVGGGGMNQYGNGGGGRNPYGNNAPMDSTPTLTNDMIQGKIHEKMQEHNVDSTPTPVSSSKTTGNTNGVPRQYSNPVEAHLIQKVTPDGTVGSMSDWQQQCIQVATAIANSYKSRYEDAMLNNAGCTSINAAQIFYQDLSPRDDLQGTDVSTKFYSIHVNAATGELEAYAVSDNGAQCTILGGADGLWQVTYVDPFRAMNIIGAVPSAMRKNGLRVVTAYTKATLDNNEKVLLRVNEAAFNPESRVTLLSEYQLREHGCVVDSLAKHHRISFENNSFGGQKFQPDANTTIPFVTRAALMTFPLEAPEPGDIHKYRTIDITSSKKWEPHLHSNDRIQDTMPLSRSINAMLSDRLQSNDLDRNANLGTALSVEDKFPLEPEGNVLGDSVDESDTDGDCFFDALEPSEHHLNHAVWSTADSLEMTDEGFYDSSESELTEKDDDDLSLPDLLEREQNYRFVNLALSYEDLQPHEDHIGHDYDWTRDDAGGVFCDPTEDINQCPIETYLSTLEDAELMGATWNFDSLAYCMSAATELHSNGKRSYSWETDSSSGDEQDDLSGDGQNDLSPQKDNHHVGDEGMEEIRNKSPLESRTEDPHGVFLYRAKHKTDNPESLRPYLAYLPVRIVRETIARTTQLAKAILRLPLVRHVKSRFGWMRKPRLRETVAMDTYFANVKSFGGGYHAAQVFFGLTSHVINVYGLRSRETVKESINDFIRYEGAPWTFRMDNAPEQNSSALETLFRELHISTEQTEPYHPQQNPAELRAVKWLKHHSSVLMDRTNCHPKGWFYCDKYVADIHNHTADESLRYAIPLTVRHGQTVDISPYLLFKFNEKVLYMDPAASHPETKEKPGYWYGVTDHCGDHLTFWILDDATERVIARSVVRPANHIGKENRRVTFDPNLDPDAQHEPVPDGLRLDGTTAMPKPRILERYRRSTKKKAKRRAKRRPTTAVIPDTGESPDPPTTVIPDTGEPQDPPTTAPFRIVDHVPNTHEVPVTHINEKPNTPPSQRLTASHRQHATTQPSQPLLRDAPLTDAVTPFPQRGEDTPKSNKSPIKSNTSPILLNPSTTNHVENPSIVTPPDMADATNLTTQPASTKPVPTTDTHAPRRSGRIAHRKAVTVATAFTRLLLMAAGVYAGHPEQSTVTMMNNWQPIQSEMVVHCDIAAAHDTLDTIGEHRTVTTSLSREERKQLQYVQECDYQQDLAEEQLHGCDLEWTAAEVTDHKLRHRGDDVHQHWKLRVLWMNGETSWVRLDDLRLQDPHVVVRYAKEHHLQQHDAFTWTVDFAEDRNNIRTILAAQTNSAQKFKFGVQVPSNVRHALWLDKVNGNTLWKEAMDKELQQINDYKTFREPVNDDELKEYTRIPYHIVFDVKFDLRRKARLVANGNKTMPDGEDIYSGVVAIESIRMAFAIAAMNKLDVCAGDVGNAFLYATTTEKRYIIAGPEFGDLAGKPLIIYKGLYGLRTSAARFHDHLAATFRELGFRPSLYDADLWIRERGDHYEMMATYVDDILCFSRDPMPIMNALKEKYILKGVGAPEYYLGGNVETLGEEWQKHGMFTALSASTYIKNSAEKIEQLTGGPLPNSVTPMVESYHPEVDDTPLLDATNASKFRTLTGCANWIITLGRYDVQYATGMLARFSMAPREGHLKAMKRVFGYLKHRPEGRLICDPTVPDHPADDKALLERWKECYPDAAEELPVDQLTPKGKAARITVYVDADHAHDVVTRRSVTGLIVKINGMVVRTVSKRQKTVESSTYGSELVAARIAVDTIVEFRFALRALGVPLDGPALLLGDNKSVVLNTTIPSSVLKKKHCAICFHRVREAIAAQAVKFIHVSSVDNESDLLTKPVSKDVFYRLTKRSLFRDHPDLEKAKRETVIKSRATSTNPSKAMFATVNTVDF